MSDVDTAIVVVSGLVLVLSFVALAAGHIYSRRNRIDRDL